MFLTLMISSLTEISLGRGTPARGGEGASSALLSSKAGNSFAGSEGLREIEEEDDEEEKEKEEEESSSFKASSNSSAVNELSSLRF